QVTLSGQLNFMDGLWSSCGMNRLLLRPGRMDLHNPMSYCTPCGFKMLASNYLGISEQSLFSETEQLIVTSKVTPAEVGKQLMRIFPSRCLLSYYQSLIIQSDFLPNKIEVGD
ncbi:hypothetical protein CFOL_v3_05060, partial [Cephalotus follicularis]